MTWGEKDAMRTRILRNLAEHMIRRGKVISDRERSNYYCCIRMIELNWMGSRFLITEVDAEVCRIEKE